MNPYYLARPLLFRLDPEKAHDLALGMLTRFPTIMPKMQGGQPVELLGLTFPNRLGLAAGLDKNGVAISAFDRSGLGFIEIGTVTPRPQPGNDRPRLYRLPEHQAVINRMGFNNDGIDALIERVIVTPRPRAILGINLGKTKNTPNEQALDDYLIGIQKAWAHADYLAINISSPNTAGLRDLQHGAALRTLLTGIKSEQQRLAASTQKHVPIVVKIAPDLDDDALNDLLDTIAACGIDGIIATNTTLDKSAVASHPHGSEQGGLSGAPLTAHATAILTKIRTRLPNIPLIAAGGVMNAADMQAKLDAGADLVQIYTGLIYHGPQLIRDCLRQLG
ncbi:quinone-dependent dihydroorotate dehydrogenase [Cardiobacterium valvarum]|uniref:quinone-dependent dihydroorotate dehydrogenase n=1 Tax=Cardiobacterium valvarum TaxID=194702 RepID=UPI0035EBAD34